jgi:CHAT domain-containing protein/Flp pilus assembly protein TadD
MIEEVNGKNGHNEKRSHPDINLMVSYVTGCCSADVREIVEEHCIDCSDCRAQLSILLQWEFAPRFSLGEAAAARARSIIMMQQKRQLNRSGHFSAASLGKRLWIHRPALAPALIIILLIAGSLFGYLLSSRQSSEERLLARMREVYRDARSFQARVTGGFAHQEYVENRNPSDPTGIDESRRIALLSELDHEVFTRQKAASQHNLGRLFMLHGDLGPAEQQFLLALKERPRDARLLIDLGALYFERGRKETKDGHVLLHKAAEHLSNAVETDPKLPEAWFNRALCYERMNLFLQAESDWKQYLTLDSDSAWATEAHEHLKELRERVTRLEKLEQNAQAEFQAAEAAGDEAKMRDLVAAHFVPVRNLAMDQLFDQYLSAAIAGAKKEADQYLLSLKRIGRLISEIKGDRFVGDAVDFVARSPLSAKKEVQAIRQILQQARQEHARGNGGGACELFSKVRNTAERIGDDTHAEIATLGLARYNHLKNESKELDKLRNRLVSDSKRRSHLQIHAKSLLALANAEGGAQRLSLCLEHSRQAAEIAKELGDAETAINGLRFVGATYAGLGDHDSAIKRFFEASSRLRDSWVIPVMAAVTYSEMGDALFRMGRYLTALPYQHEAVRMCEQSGNTTFLAYMIHSLGLTYGMLDRHEEATRYLNDAVARTEAIPDQMARLHLQIDMYTSSGDLYLQQKKFNEAIATYRRALESIGMGNNRFYLSSIHQGLAMAYLANGQDAEAEVALKESIRLAEEAREQISDASSRSAFLASRQGVYRTMVGFQFFNKNNQEQAFNYAEIAKGRELLDALAGSTKVSTTDGQIKLAVSRSATPLTLDQVQSALPANAQLLQYAIGEKNLMIWLVTRDRLVTAKADIGADNLRNKITAYLDELRKHGDLECLNSQASDLYRMLIAPISNQLDPNRALCIVPDGVLQDLPFASLVSPETKRYLIEDFSLVINPSASVFARTLELSRGKQRSESEPFLALGNPSFNQQAFPKLFPLHKSEQEIDRIRSLYSQRLILSRRQATESALAQQIGSYEIVHLATHTLSDQQSSMLSTIFLAGEGDSASEGQNPDRVAYDGALRAHEIYRLKPERTRLVILSSSRSGLGDRSRNEAMGGLAQAFLVAGVPTVIASLWDVDDDGAARLMEKFHAAHRGKRLAFGDALRQSQMSFLQTAPARLHHPYFWATFIVTGDGLAG